MREVGPVEVEPVGRKGGDTAVERVCASLPAARLQATDWSASVIFSGGPGWASFGLFAVCFLGGGAARAGAWIVWTERDREQRLNWVAANSRFLIFPWVRIKNLASKALSLAAQRIR